MNATTSDPAFWCRSAENDDLLAPYRNREGGPPLNNFKVDNTTLLIEFIGWATST